MNLRVYLQIAALAAMGGPLWAQTEINLTRQGRIESGAQLPAQCSQGQLYLKSSPSSGATLYFCSQPGVWSTSADFAAGAGISITGDSIAADDAVVPVYLTGTGSPSVDCTAGRDFYVDVAAGALYYCKAQGLWQALSAAGHTHPAGDINSGTLSPGVLPAPGAASLGGVQSKDCAGAGHVVRINTDGSVACSADASSGSTAHALLGATHNDTTAGTAARGDLITAQGAPAAWTRLPLGANGAYLRSNGSDLLYGAIALSDLPAGYSWSSLSGVPAAFAPASHAASHQNGGADEIATSVPSVNAIPKAGSGGALAAGWLPNPSASTLGGVQSLAAVSHRWINSISATGVPSATQPACGDLSNAAASCSTDTTNAANITSGTLGAARLPAPTASALGGVQSKDCTGAGHVVKIGVDGAVSCAADSGGGGVTAGPGLGSSGSTVSWNPMDTSIDWLTDNFAPVGSATNNNVGLLRWNFVSASSSMPAAQGVHAGLFQWTTTATANSVSYLTLFGAGNGASFLPTGGGPFTVTNWEEKWIFKTPAVSTNVKLRIGLLPGNLNSDFADTNGFYVRYVNDGGTGCSIHATDASWTAFAGDGGNTVSGSLGSISASTWYALDLKSTTVGQVVVTLTPDGGSPMSTTLSASSGSPGAVSTVPMFPGIQMVTCDSTAKTIVVDDFRWFQTGIAR